MRRKSLAAALVAFSLLSAVHAPDARARAVQDASCLSMPEPWRVRVDDQRPQGRPLTVVTYNVHAGLGGGHGLRAKKQEVTRNLDGIAAAIVAQAPDVVALNEVDFDSDRTARVDQVQYVADALSRATGRKWHAARALAFRRNLPGLRVRMGSAVLSPHPIASNDVCILEEGKPCFAPRPAHPLPELLVRSLMSRLGGERRAALKATVVVDGRPVDVLVTHLEAFDKDDREAQAAHILARMVTPGRTTILAGDLNTVPAAFPERGMFPADDRTHDVVTSRGLMDPRFFLMAVDPKRGPASFATYPAAAPSMPIDAVLATTDLWPVRVDVVGGTHSDHRGLAATYRFVDEPRARAALDDAHARMKQRQMARLLTCDVPKGGSKRAERAKFLADATGLLDVASDDDRAALVEAVLPIDGGLHVLDVLQSARRAGSDRFAALLARLRLDDVRARMRRDARERLDAWLATTTTAEASSPPPGSPASGS